MPSPTELERLAVAANAMRPEWPVRSILTLLQREHTHRAYRDLAVALAYVAADPTTQTPRRLSEAGPWWHTTSDTAPITTPRPHHPRCDVPGHEHELATNCRACRSERLGRDENRTDTLAMPDAQLATNIRGAALVRQALTHNPAPTPIDGRSLAAGMSMED